MPHDDTFTAFPLRLPTAPRPRPERGLSFGLCAALVVLSSAGCKSAPDRQAIVPEAQLLGIEIRGDTETEKYDLNGDGRPDLFRIYVLRGPKDDPESRTRHLARQDLDLNFDDRIDMRRHFNEDGVVVREEMDLDFDGVFDAVDYYSNGQLYRRDMALNFNGRPSIVKFYTANKMVRKERDTNSDGNMDTFEYYSEGRLTRIGVDRNGDGVPDVYTEVASEDPPPPERGDDDS